MPQQQNEAALLARRASLIPQLTAASGAERDRLLEEIDEIDRQLRDIDLDAGVAAGEEVDDAIGNLDEIRDRQGQDAVSSLERGLDQGLGPQDP